MDHKREEGPPVKDALQRRHRAAGRKIRLGLIVRWQNGQTAGNGGTQSQRG